MPRLLALPRLSTPWAPVALRIRNDWGITPLSAPDANDLLELIDDRPGSRSTLLTSRFLIEHGHTYLGNPTVVDALWNVASIRLIQSPCKETPCARHPLS